MKTLLSVICVSILSLCAAFPGTAAAADYPNKPIKLVIPSAPGGSSDIPGRILANHLGPKLGVDIPVINVTGAAGFAGTLQVAEAKPDGYSILLHLPTFMTSYHTGVARFTWCDMEPIARVQQFYEVLAVRSDAPWKTVAELIDDARKNPGKIKWGLNIGAGLHFMALDFADASNTVNKWKYVASGGDETSVKALLGGHIDVCGTGDMVVAQHVKNGTVRVLGAFADKRIPLMPDVPTFKEQGIDSQFVFDITLYAPKGTDKAVLDKLRTAIREVSNDPAYIKEITAQGFVPAYLDGQELWNLLLNQDVQFYKFARLGNLIPPRK